MGVADVDAGDFHVVAGGGILEAVEDGEFVAADAAAGGPEDEQDGFVFEGVQVVVAAIDALESELRRGAAGFVVAKDEEGGEA